MKKWIVVAFLLALALAACGKRNTYQVQITVPAGSEKAFYFSEEQIAANGKTITISSPQELGDAEVLLCPVSDTVTPGYVATALTPGKPVTFDADKGQWFTVGISVQNDTNVDKTFFVEVKGVEVRIP
jgi:hypothetical protein